MPSVAGASGEQSSAFGEGLQGAGGVHFSVSRHTVAQLNAATHQKDLVQAEAGPVQLHVDAAHMGVGGDDSWSPSVRYPVYLPTIVGKKCCFVVN